MLPRLRTGPADDVDRFGAAGLTRLRAAAADAAWLVDHGYPPLRVVEWTGNRHELDVRQRLALQRSLCTAEQIADRQLHRVTAVAGATLHVDGFNLLVTLEVALAGGLVLRCRDGCLRDVAGVHGNYGRVAQTDIALAAVASVAKRLAIARLHWLLDAPIGHSGNLAQHLREASWPCPCEVEVVADADRALVGLAVVASSDGRVLERADAWFDLAAAVLHGRRLRVVQPFARWRAKAVKGRARNPLD